MASDHKKKLLNNLFIQKVYYSNVIILSKDGNPLTTVSNSKADWYIKKGLGIQVSPPKGSNYPRAIKLNFKANMKNKPKVYNLCINKDQCVICGTNGFLTLHHVIPYVIRRHFPKKEKDYSRQWCVLLCWKCHKEVEELIQPLYKYNFPTGQRVERKTNLTLQIIKHNNNLDKLPVEKLNWLLKHSDYKTIEEIPAYTSHSRAESQQEVRKHHQEHIRVWAHNFIQEKGGVEGIKEFFRSMFLQLNPKYLPLGYLEIDP